MLRSDLNSAELALTCAYSFTEQETDTNYLSFLCCRLE